MDAAEAIDESNTDANNSSSKMDTIEADRIAANSENTQTIKNLKTMDDDEPFPKKPKLESQDDVCVVNLSESDDRTQHSKNTDTDSKYCEKSLDNLNKSNVCESKSSFKQPCEDSVTERDSSDSTERKSSLTEIQAGITEYLGSHKRFSAIIKQRYSDFIVNEIDQQGNVIHLSQMEPPVDPEEENKTESIENHEIVSNIINDEDIAKLENLVKSEDKKEVVNIVAPPDKETRTKIHLAVKKKYVQLETKTADVNSQKMIQVMWKSGKSRGDRNPDDWPASKKDLKFVKFVLYKENKDTMDAIGLIAKNLKVKEGLFQYAGTKDKRAKTSQEVTAHRIHPKRLHFMNKVLWNMGLGNFQYVREPLKLGQLTGNQFTIVLRNVQGSSETIDNALTSLKTNGFVNYFGLQRFGTTSVPTHKVGCALLHGDWEKAVDFILMPRADYPTKDAFQKVWMETRDPEATLKVTPIYCGLERNLLSALKRKMKPFNALEKISRNIRLLYLHSYQALVWNQIVSRRLKVFGHKPVVGDLVQTGSSENLECPSPTLVTQENLDQFSMHDVVLPLPGHDVIYPNNDVYGWYRETMAADGLDIDNMKRPQKDYSLPGAYRPVTVCPSDVSWSHHRYDDYQVPLTLSDMDVMKGMTLPLSHNKGKFKAVVLKMNLPTSCYATMALREILSEDTSAAHQTSLNAA